MSLSPYNYGAYLRPDEFKTGPMMQGPMATNPLAAGVQLGMLGAAAGLGVAGVQRALRLKAGNAVPPPVLRSMLIGTLIGGGIGVVGAHTMKPGVTKPPITNWHDLAGKIDQDFNGAMYKTSQYAGLRHIADPGFEKEAALPLAALAPLAWKGLMAAMAISGGVGAVRHGGKAISQAASGQGRAALGSTGRALLNAAYAVPMLGGAAKGLRGLQLAGKLSQAGKGSRAALAFARWGSRARTPMVGRMLKWAPKADAGRLSQLTHSAIQGARGTRAGRALGGPRFGKYMTSPRVTTMRRLQAGTIQRLADSPMGARLAQSQRLQRLAGGSGRALGIERKLDRFAFPAIMAEGFISGRPAAGARAIDRGMYPMPHRPGINFFTPPPRITAPGVRL